MTLVWLVKTRSKIYEDGLKYRRLIKKKKKKKELESNLIHVFAGDF